jgi:hypothetical protein
LTSVSAFFGAGVAGYVNYHFTTRVKIEEKLHLLRMEATKNVIEKFVEIKMQFEYYKCQTYDNDFFLDKTYLKDIGNKYTYERFMELNNTYHKNMPYLNKKQVEAIDPLIEKIASTIAEESHQIGMKGLSMMRISEWDVKTLDVFQKLYESNIESIVSCIGLLYKEMNKK